MAVIGTAEGESRTEKNGAKLFKKSRLTQDCQDVTGADIDDSCLLFAAMSLWLHSLIRSRRELSCDRSSAPSKASSPHSAIECFLFQIPIPLIFLRSSSSCLRPLLFLYMLFRRQFLRKMWPIHLDFYLFVVCRIFLSSQSLCNTSSFLIRSPSKYIRVLMTNPKECTLVFLYYAYRAPSCFSLYGHLQGVVHLLQKHQTVLLQRRLYLSRPDNR